MIKFEDIKNKIEANDGFQLNKEDLNWFNSHGQTVKVDQVALIPVENVGHALVLHTPDGQIVPLAWKKDDGWYSH